MGLTTLLLPPFILSFVIAAAIDGAPTDATPKTLTLPLTVSGVEGLAYTIPATIGGQAFNLTLDMNTPDLVLFAKGYRYTNRACGNATEIRNFFDPSLSYTYSDQGDEFSGWAISRNPLFPYMEVACDELFGASYRMKGVSAADALSLSSKSIGNVQFALAKTTFYPLNPGWASDGVFPLAWSDTYSNALSSVLDSVGRTQEVTLWLNGSPTNNPTPGGLVTFGGKDTKNCGRKWTKIRSTKLFWIVNSISVSVGRTHVKGLEALISVASPFLAAPPEQFRSLIKALKGKYNDDLHLYTVDCGKIGLLPAINITFGSGFSIQYTVTAEKYVAKMNTRLGPKCALLLVQTHEGYKAWTIGAQFLPKRCINLDYDSGYISIADPVQSN